MFPERIIYCLVLTNKLSAILLPYQPAVGLINKCSYFQSSVTQRDLEAVICHAFSSCDNGILHIRSDAFYTFKFDKFH